MERRKFVVGLGALAAGTSAAVGSGAFSAALIDDRDANITVSADGDALVALVPGYDDDLAGSDSTVSSDTVAEVNNQLAIDIENDGAGVNVGSTYQVGAIAGDQKDILDETDQAPGLSSTDVIYGEEDDQFFDDKTTAEDPAFGIKNNTSDEILAQLNWEADDAPPDGVDAAMVVDGDPSDLGDGSASSFAFGLDSQPTGETTFGISQGEFAYVSIIIVVEDDADPGDFSGTLEIRAEGAVSQV